MLFYLLNNLIYISNILNLPTPLFSYINVSCIVFNTLKGNNVELQTSMYNVWNMFKMIVLPKTNKRNTGDEFCLNRLKVCNLFNCI